MTPLIFAQSLGEYGAVSGGVMAQLANAVESATQWIELSWRQDRAVWIGVGICVGLGLWLTRKG